MPASSPQDRRECRRRHGSRRWWSPSGLRKQLPMLKIKRIVGASVLGTSFNEAIHVIFSVYPPTHPCHAAPDDADRSESGEDARRFAILIVDGENPCLS